MPNLPALFDGEDDAQPWLSWLMSQPAGRWAVVGTGIAVIGVGTRGRPGVVAHTYLRPAPAGRHGLGNAGLLRLQRAFGRSTHLEIA